jgi:hypothetical protein
MHVPGANRPQQGGRTQFILPVSDCDTNASVCVTSDLFPARAPLEIRNSDAVTVDHLPALPAGEEQDQHHDQRQDEAGRHDRCGAMVVARPIRDTAEAVVNFTSLVADLKDLAALPASLVPITSRKEWVASVSRNSWSEKGPTFPCLSAKYQTSDTQGLPQHRPPRGVLVLSLQLYGQFNSPGTFQDEQQNVNRHISPTLPCRYHADYFFLHGRIHNVPLCLWILNFWRARRDSNS